MLLLRHPIPVRASVDIVEVNHVVDPLTCQVRLEQVIWWDWCGWHGCYEVRDWRMLHTAGHPVRFNGKWLNRWAEEERQIEIVGAVRRETWTWYDVEVDERVVLPEQYRRKIGR